MAIERCEKCGKPFMSKSELERHKMWEHPVPVSPFEERLKEAAAGTNNRGINPEDLQKLTSDVVMADNSSSNNNSNDITTIGGGTQRRKVPFRPFRL